MANKVQRDDIIKINELYLIYKNKAEVARQTGFSASTVSKYIIPNYVSEEITSARVIRFNGYLPNFQPELLRIDDLARLCVLTEEELKDIEILKGEIVL